MVDALLLGTYALGQLSFCTRTELTEPDSGLGNKIQCKITRSQQWHTPAKHSEGEIVNAYSNIFKQG